MTIVHPIKLPLVEYTNQEVDRGWWSELCNIGGRSWRRPINVQMGWIVDGQGYTEFRAVLDCLPNLEARAPSFVRLTFPCMTWQECANVCWTFWILIKATIGSVSFMGGVHGHTHIEDGTAWCFKLFICSEKLLVQSSRICLDLAYGPSQILVFGRPRSNILLMGTKLWGDHIQNAFNRINPLIHLEGGI